MENCKDLKYGELVEKIDIIEVELNSLKKEKKNFEKYEDYKTMGTEVAIMVSALKDSFCEQGFTEEQALSLTIEIIRARFKLEG